MTVLLGRKFQRGRNGKPGQAAQKAVEVGRELEQELAKKVLSFNK